MKREFSEEHKRKLSIAIKKSMTPERRKKISELVKKSLTPEIREKISKAGKGRIPVNKGVYGEKTRRLKEGLPIECKNHGFHENWSYNQEYRQIRCRYCSIEIAKKYQYNYPFRKFITYTKSRKRYSNIDAQYIAQLYLNQNGYCVLSGIPLHEEFMSLDRID